MKDFEKLGRELLSSEKGDKLRSLADTEDARALSAMVSERELESAVLSGDAQALSGILAKVLATEQGKRLAERLTRE